MIALETAAKCNGESRQSEGYIYRRDASPPSHTHTTGPPRLPGSKSLFLAPWKATLGPKRLRVSTTAPFDELAGETSACFRAQCGFSQKTSFSPQFPSRGGSSLLSAAYPGRAPALRSQGLDCSLQKFRPHRHNPGQSSPSWPHCHSCSGTASPQTRRIFFPQASPPCSRSRSYWQCIYQLSRSSRQQMGTEASCNTSRQSPAQKTQHFSPGEAVGPGAEHASAAQERMQPALGLSIPPGAGSLLLVMLRGEDPSKLEGPRAESPSCKHSPAQK